jgi:hypothetical protein
MMAVLLALAGTAACDGVSSEGYEIADHGSVDQGAVEQVVPSVPVQAMFEGNVIYLGLDINPPKLTPGDRAVITQYWRLNTPLSAVERTAFGAWTTYLHAEGPYGRGVVATQRTVEAPNLEQWRAGTVIKEEFTLQVPGDWTEPAVWLFAGIGEGSTDARPATSLHVVQGPDEDGWRIRALTVRVKRPWSGGLPSWVTEARRSELSRFVE